MSVVDEAVPVPRLNAQQRAAISGVATKVLLAKHIVGVGWLRVRVRISTPPGYAQFYFGVEADSIALDSVTAATTGYTLESGQSEDFYIFSSSLYTHLIIIASGAGFVDLMRAGKENVGKSVTG